MHKRILAAVGLVAVFSVGACGSSSSGGGGGSGGSGASGGSGGSGGGTNVPMSDVPQKLATALCGVLDGCLGSYYTLFLNGQDCETLNQRQVEQGQFAAIQAAIDAGKVTYHGDKVDACIQAIKAAGCNLFSDRLPAECQDVFQGTVQAGGSCTINEECTGGNVCQFSGGTCPGTCQPLAASGASCDSDDECQSGLTCQSKVCTAPGKEGAQCGGSAPDCLTGLYCAGYDSKNGVPGTCTKFSTVFNAAQGQPCDLSKSSLCVVGSSCEVGVNGSTPTFTCVAPVAKGAACHLAFPSECPSGQYCMTTQSAPLNGTCTDLPGDGAACGSGNVCAAYTACDTSTSKCVALQNDGGSCSSDAFCYSKHCVSGTCKAGLCTQ